MERSKRDASRLAVGGQFVGSVGFGGTYTDKGAFNTAGLKAKLEAPSKNGKKIVFSSSRGDHSFIGLYDLDKKAEAKFKEINEAYQVV